MVKVACCGADGKLQVKAPLEAGRLPAEILALTPVPNCTDRSALPAPFAPTVTWRVPGSPGTTLTLISGLGEHVTGGIWTVTVPEPQLEVCCASPEYVACTVSVPKLTNWSVTEHAALADDNAASAHNEEFSEPILEVQVIDPVGVAGAALVSVTIAVH